MGVGVGTGTAVYPAQFLEVDRSVRDQGERLGRAWRESRESETLHALVRVLAFTLPIACELLWLRSRARNQPDAPATEVLTAQQLKILRALARVRCPHGRQRTTHSGPSRA